MQIKKERRKYLRYNTEVKIYFHVNYDLKTKVRFQVLDEKESMLLSKKYPALSRDVSAEGLRFNSGKELKKGNSLYLEVYLPRKKRPVRMTGQVRWSKKVLGSGSGKNKFDTGVKLLTVSGKPVSNSIYFDNESRVIWSTVLDSVFGSFRKLMQKNTVPRRGNRL
ncbi:MAG: PilZ domain-containing protein [Candidatus Omnitrophota bacterium]|nr:PilZ domain-containing protein [Candidatus Omnitrophota bacterium]